MFGLFFSIIKPVMIIIILYMKSWHDWNALSSFYAAKNH